jgi:hypothetical protein
MSSSSIIHFAAPSEIGGAAVEGFVMPTAFAFAHAGPPGRPSQPGNGRPPCPPGNPHCIPEPSGFVMTVLAIGILVALRLTSSKMNQLNRKGE